MSPVLGREPVTPVPPGPAADLPPTMDQVSQLLTQADPATFYQRADQFDRLAGGLQRVADLFRKHVLSDDDLWQGASAQAFGAEMTDVSGAVDKLSQDAYGPAYGILLRRSGDALANGQQRLRDLYLRRGQDPAPDATQYDQQARQIVQDIAIAYEDVGRAVIAYDNGSPTGLGPSGSAPPATAARWWAGGTGTTYPAVGDSTTGQVPTVNQPAGTQDWSVAPPATAGPFVLGRMPAGSAGPIELTGVVVPDTGAAVPEPSAQPSGQDGPGGPGDASLTGGLFLSSGAFVLGRSGTASGTRQQPADAGKGQQPATTGVATTTAAAAAHGSPATQPATTAGPAVLSQPKTTVVPATSAGTPPRTTFPGRVAPAVSAGPIQPAVPAAGGPPSAPVSAPPAASNVAVAPAPGPLALTRSPVLPAGMGTPPATHVPVTPVTAAAEVPPAVPPLAASPVADATLTGAGPIPLTQPGTGTPLSTGVTTGGNSFAGPGALIAPSPAIGLTEMSGLRGRSHLHADPEAWELPDIPLRVLGRPPKRPDPEITPNPEGENNEWCAIR